MNDLHKERFGSARFYCQLNPAPDNTTLHAAVHAIARRAEAETRTACLVCGAMAQAQSYGGYHVVLCAAHQPKGERGASDALTGFNAWLQDGEGDA